MKPISKLSFGGFVVMLALTGCAEIEPLTDYRPVVDPSRTNQARFERDLEACRAIAVQVEADYRQRQEEQMAANIMAGLIVGAITGAVVGSGSGYQGELAAYGAASGMAAGAAATDYTHDLVTFGPRRIVDRCMTERGHVVLNDPGRG
ncbi:glycine zipper family protein [Tabrizicola soli]|uniref:Glycine zipper family protein n=2 Tax=Tabrizicola soli TaxID=2185115 RepID=A0ABV7DUJ4_9RHOB